MAMAFPTLFFVKTAQRREPSVFIDILTQGLPKLSNSSLASVITSPSNGARPLRSLDLMAYNSKIRPVLSKSAPFTPHFRRRSFGNISFTSFMAR